MKRFFTYLSGLTLALGLGVMAHSAQAYTYNSYEVTNFSVTQSTTTAGASNTITVTFSIPSDMTGGMTTAGYLSLSSPYLYTYKNGTYSYDYVNLANATITSSQLTKSNQSSNYVSFYPTANLAAGSSVSITITGATNPSTLEGTGTFSLYGSQSNTSTAVYNYFYASASQVYGDVDLTVTMKDANGTTPIPNVNVSLSYYNTSNYSDYESFYGYTNAAGQVQFAGLTSGRTYNVYFYYSGSATTNSTPSSTTLTFSGTAASASYNFLTSNVTTHFVDRNGTAISGAYWYFYRTDYTNYTTDYVWRSGTTNSAGTITAAAQKDGAYTLSVYYSTENTYYTYNFTVTNGVVSGLSDPVRVPAKEVSGTVYAGSTAAANVYVYIHNRDWSVYRQTYTDASGNFSAALGVTDTYTVEVNSYGLPAGYFPPDPTTISVTANVASSALTLNLKASTKTISGQVTKKASSAAGIASGTPVTDASVYAYQNTGNYNYAYTTTDSNGNYSLPAVGGTWTVYIYQQAWPSTWVYTGDNVTTTFANNASSETATINFSVTPYDAHITGRVVYPDGSAVGNSAVYIYAYGGENNRVYSYANTDSSGNFDLKTTAGTFKLSMYFYGSSGVATYSAPALDPQTVEAGKTKNLGDVSLVSKNSYLQGSVKIRDTNEAVTSHSVYAYKTGGNWDWASATTDSNGFYSMQVSPGTWTIQTYAGDVTTSTGQKVLYTGGSLSANVGNAETVAGQDFNFDIADSSVTFVTQDGDGNDMTDEYGWASVRQKDSSDTYGWYNTGCYVQHGTCTLNISSGQEYKVTYYSYRNWNWSSSKSTSYTFSHVEVDGVQTSTVSVDSGEIQEVDLVMTENSATLSGQFLDQDGNPAKVQASVYASSEDNQWASTYVNNDSSYSLKVPAGTWRISYWTAGNYQTMENKDWKVTVAEGETGEIDFTVLKTNSVISGTVLDPNGEAVTTPIFVKASTVYGKDQTATGDTYGLIEKTAYTDSSGNFSLDVPSGTYYLTASSPDYLAPQPIEVNADTKGTAKNITLAFLAADNTISGLVMDDTGITINTQRTSSVGDPVSGAFVYMYCAGGSYANTESDTTGTYVLNVPSQDTCYVGAVYQSGNTAYYSDQSQVEVKNEPVSQDISLNQSFTIPQGQTVKFDPTEGTVITMEDGTSVEIPANSITADSSITEVTVSVTPKVKIVHQPGLEPLSVSYEFTATDQNGNPISQFSSNVKITLPYDEDEVDEAETDEDSLQVGYYEDAAGAWQNVDGGVVKNEQDNEFEISVDHFSSFGVLASRSIIPATTSDGNGGTTPVDPGTGTDDDTGSDGDTGTVVTPEDGVLSSPTTIVVKERFENKLKLNWNAVTSADHYIVKVLTPKKHTVIRRLQKNKSEGVIKHLQANTSYKIRIRSVGPSGSKSGWSTAKLVHTKPAAPTQVEALSVDTTSETISWDAGKGKISVYLIRVYDAAGDEVQRVNSKTNSITIKNLEAGKSYTARVRAEYNKQVFSVFSAQVSFQTSAE